MILALALALLAACAQREHAAPAPPPAPAGGAAQTYAGEIPCADCPGIQVVLTLFADGTYRLRNTYRERGAVVYELGHWERVQGDSARLRLFTAGPTGAVVREYRRVAPDRLRQLDREGREIRSSFNYDLGLQAAVDELSGPMPLRGQLEFGEGATAFVECGSGQRYGIDRAGGDYAALERAYRAARAAGNAPTFVVFSGRFHADRPRSVTVEQFGRLASESCATPRQAQTPLRETRWEAQAIRGRPLELPPGAHAPALVLTADRRVQGFGGCNRLSGSYAQKNGELRFQALASTRMACLGAMQNVEAAFLKALADTTAQRVQEDLLELLDDQGSVLMQLRARPAQ